MTVWAEGIFLLNAALDYLLMAGAVRLRGGRPQRRILWAAGLGGLWAVLALVLSLDGIAFAAAGFCLLSFCAFGFSAEGLRLGAVFLGLSLALCGIQTAISPMAGTVVRTREGILLRVSLPVLVSSAALLYGMTAAVSGAVTARKPLLVPVQATAAGRTVRFRSLWDTGSFLRDPLTGRPVVLADSTVARTLLQMDPMLLREPAAAMERLMRECPALKPRLIPYRAVGVEQGMLLGVRCTVLSVRGEERQGGILAFAPGSVSEDGSYHGLTGG